MFSMISNGNYDRLIEMIKQDEGCRLDSAGNFMWYDDGLGNLTGGYGHEATKHDDTSHPMTPIEADLTCRNDVDIAAKMLLSALPFFQNLDDIRQSALINMCFNMGWSRLSGFHKMLAAISVGNWQAAHDEALNSDWAKDFPIGVGTERSNEIADMLLTGKWK
jgi:lysozyme